MGNPWQAVSGIFGGGGRNPYTGQVQQSVDQFRGLGQKFGNLASIGQGNYSRYAPQAGQSLEDYAGLLRRNTTDSDKAGYINQMTAPVQDEFNAGQAGLAQQLQQRGLSPDSSVGIGGQIGLIGQRARALGAAGSNALQYFDQDRLNRLQALHGLYQGQADNALGQQGQFLGMQQGANQAGLQGLMPLYQQAEQERQAKQQAGYGLLSSLGGLAGSYFGGGGSLAGLFGGGGRSTPSYKDMGLGYR